jgi:hypothetical protein
VTHRREVAVKQQAQIVLVLTKMWMASSTPLLCQQTAISGTFDSCIGGIGSGFARVTVGEVSAVEFGCEGLFGAASGGPIKIA